MSTMLAVCHPEGLHRGAEAVILRCILSSRFVMFGDECPDVTGMLKADAERTTSIHSTVYSLDSY